MALNLASQNAGAAGVAGIITHVGVHTLAYPGTGTDAAAGEASGGTYARVPVAWAAAAGGRISNSGALLIDVPAGDYAYLTYWNALTGNVGNYRGYAPLSSVTRGFGTVTDIAGNVIVSTGHGLVNGQRVLVYNVLGEVLPAGLVEGTLYFVVGVTADTFQVSATLGGAAVDIIAVGDLYFQRAIPEPFGSAGQISVAAGALSIDASTV